MIRYRNEGPGFRVLPPLEDRTAELPKVRTDPAPIMAAPADSPLTVQHRNVLDAIDTLSKETRKHLTEWDARESDGDAGAAAAMGQAIKTAKQLSKAVRELHSGLVMEDYVTAVEDDREAYEIRKNSETGTV